MSVDLCHGFIICFYPSVAHSKGFKEGVVYCNGQFADGQFVMAQLQCVWELYTGNNYVSVFVDIHQYTLGLYVQFNSACLSLRLWRVVLQVCYSSTSHMPWLHQTFRSVGFHLYACKYGRLETQAQVIFWRFPKIKKI